MCAILLLLFSIEITYVLGSIPERRTGGSSDICNTSPIFNPNGDLLAIHRKTHLFDIELPTMTFRESDSMSGGSEAVTIIETGKDDGRERLVPLAYNHSADYGKIGVGICYDVRFPEMAMIAARKGASLACRFCPPVIDTSAFPGCIAMIYPGAFNLTTGPLHWELLQRARYAFSATRAES